jgi:hypothetical protein
VQTPVDYVISYMMGSVWSGATPPLSWSVMKSARNLGSLLPNMPPSGEPVLGTVQVYLNILGPAIAFGDELNLGSWILGQLQANTSAPTAANGGMQTVNPNTGVLLPFQVGYAINSAISSIQNDLQNTSRNFSIDMSISQASQSSFSVSVGGSGGITLGEVISFSLGGRFDYNMNTFAGTSATATVSMKYIGFTMVPTAPTAWQQATDIGWFYGAPIAEAWANWQSGTKPTGFNFVSDPTPILGPNGSGLAQITNLLISNFPTITITYTNADYQRFQEAWSEQASGNIRLFGFLDVGSFSQGVYSSTVTSNGSNSSFSVTFTPSPQILTVPALQQTAYVIGGTFDYPALDQPGVVRTLLHLVQ